MSNKDAFNKWLNNKLKSLNTDENVFGSYILGILEGDETTVEKREALEGILSAIIETDLEYVVKEITNEWEKCTPKSDMPAVENEDVDAKLARLLETKHLTTTVQRQYTEEELRIREQILSQYSQVEYNDGYDEEVEEAAGTSSTNNNNDPLMIKNTNASDVAALAKERREQAKNESKAKKEKDKVDREKQKQLREEKKEKRKTVKGERRR